LSANFPVTYTNINMTAEVHVRSACTNQQYICSWVWNCQLTELPCYRYTWISHSYKLYWLKINHSCSIPCMLCTEKGINQWSFNFLYFHKIQIRKEPGPNSNWPGVHGRPDSHINILFFQVYTVVCICNTILYVVYFNLWL